LDNTKTTKLLNVLEKFTILDSSAEDDMYFQYIKQKHGKGVLSANGDDYINSLLGYILSPQVRKGDGWEISYNDFKPKVESLTNQFRSGTIIFPKKYATLEINNNEINQYNDYLFVKKLKILITTM